MVHGMEEADLLLDNSQPPFYAGMIMRHSQIFSLENSYDHNSMET
jgi:hypothetical protein